MSPCAASFIPALRRFLCAALLLPSCMLAMAEGSGASGRVPKPVLEAARGGQCVEDAAYMRRNHMQLLKHQRGDTLRGGIRTGKYSLKTCIDCHASASTNSVNTSAGDFCQSCHNYAAVSLDCFGCHASKPAANQVAKAPDQLNQPQVKP